MTRYRVSIHISIGRTAKGVLTKDVNAPNAFSAGVTVMDSWYSAVADAEVMSIEVTELPKATHARK